MGQKYHLLFGHTSEPTRTRVALLSDTIDPTDEQLLREFLATCNGRRRKYYSAATLIEVRAVK
jgi:hypothetical protein